VNEEALAHWGLSRQKQTNKQKLFLLQEHGAEALEPYNKTMRFPLPPSKIVYHISLSFKVLMLVSQSSAVLLRSDWYYKLHDVTTHKTDTFINTAVCT
jgi:hypothetical protein